MTKKGMLHREIERVKDKLSSDEIYRLIAISSYATHKEDGLSYIQVSDLIKEVTGNEVNSDDIQISNERL